MDPSPHATQIRLARRPEGEPDDSCFSITHDEVPSPGDGQLRLRVVYLSLDPYMRGRMSCCEVVRRAGRGR